MEINHSKIYQLQRNNQTDKMGLFGSDESNENSGKIQNSISINDTVTTYGNELTMLLAIIVGIKIIETAIFLQKSLCRRIRKNLGVRQQPNGEA